MTVQPADGLSLAAEFPDPAHEQWQSLVEGVLRKSGKDVSGSAAEEALSTTVEDGLITRPLYTSRDDAPDVGLPGFAPFTRGSTPQGSTAGGWGVRQRHASTDPVRLNESVLGDLENGATSLWLTVGAPAVCRSPVWRGRWRASTSIWHRSYSTPGTNSTPQQPSCSGSIRSAGSRLTRCAATSEPTRSGAPPAPATRRT